VWERVSTFDGVNDELMPLMRMTSPRRMRSLQPEDVVRRIFRHRHKRLRRHFGG
jgi:hypothetical protein